MDNGDFILGRIERLEKRLEELITQINSHYKLLHGEYDFKDLGVSDSSKPVE